MKIQKIHIVTGRGPDTVCLWTDLPPSYWPWDQTPGVYFDCAANTAIEYVAKNFAGIPVEVTRIAELYSRGSFFKHEVKEDSENGEGSDGSD